MITRAALENPTPTEAEPTVSKPVAVIDVGTTSIRMAIAEIDQAGNVKTLEQLSQAVDLGKDTFTTGGIEKATIEDCVRVLKSYRAKLAEYQIAEPTQVRAVATSSVREASNQVAFLDRIYIATGIQIEPLDEAEVTRVTYLGIQPFLKAEPSLVGANAIVVEVGGGNTDLLVVRDSDVLFSHSYRLGSLRLHEMLERYRAPTRKLRDLMESRIDQVVEQIQHDVPQADKVELIAMGGDVRFAASQLSPERSPHSLTPLRVDALESFAESILGRGEDELVRKYHLNISDAETIGAALLTYVQLAKAFELPRILVTNANLRDGLLKEIAAKQAWTSDFEKQVVRSAIDLGRRCGFDALHALHVAELSSKLFQALQAEHQLDAHCQTILYLGALLHEIGLFVNQRAHHKHAYYMISNSDIFGLGTTDTLLVALVARYHRRASPQPTHEGYSLLDRDQRVAVSKMAALLRIAVALAESRSQRIQEFECRSSDSQLIISIPHVDDLSLEQLALRQNVSLFEEVFGMQVLLRNVRQ